MDEYIKREDALDAVLFALVGTGVQSRAIYAIREVPTTDVVPKSEVQRIVGEYYDKCDECRTNCAKAIAREIFEEIERIFDGKKYVPYPLQEIAELKKKYTEDLK